MKRAGAESHETAAARAQAPPPNAPPPASRAPQAPLPGFPSLPPSLPRGDDAAAPKSSVPRPGPSARRFHPLKYAAASTFVHARRITTAPRSGRIGLRQAVGCLVCSGRGGLDDGRYEHQRRGPAAEVDAAVVPDGGRRGRQANGGGAGAGPRGAWRDYQR